MCKTFSLSLAIFIFANTGLANAQTPDTTAPSIPSDFTATVGSYGQITLTWSASTDNSAVDGYYIYRNSVLITATNATSYIDAGLSPSGYTYTVAAYDAAKNISGRSSPKTVTLTVDDTPPSTPSGLSVSTASTSTASFAQVNMSWHPSTDNVGVVGYYIYRNGTLITTSTQLSVTSYTDSNASPDTYTYTVAAYDAAKNISGRSSPASITIVSDVFSPSVPLGISAIATSSSKIYLSWNPSKDDVGVVGYYIYRNNARILTLNATSYTDSGLPPDATYTYTVAALDSAGNVSNRSIPASATAILDTTPPTNPGNLFFTIGSSAITLHWNTSFDDIAVAGYYVYRDGAQIANIASTSYRDSGISPGTYSYTVAAYDASGNVSSQPLPVSPTLLPSPINATATQPTAVTPTAVTTPSAPPQSLNNGSSFTISLYFGVRNAQVKKLQSFLAGQGYLDPTKSTGFFGKLTEQAVKKFQCDRGIVCDGGAAGSGWGIVGAKTRGVLNGLYTAGAAQSSADGLNAQIQALRAQILNLQLQLQSH